MKSQTCIILAAGRSQRFPSPIGKIAYPFRSRPLLDHTLQKVSSLFKQCIVVISPSKEEWFKAHYTQLGIQYVIQNEPRGTWDALACAIGHIAYPECIVVNGDSPLIPIDLLMRTSEIDMPIGLVTVNHPCPVGYGRIIRSHEGDVIGIIEEKDLPPSAKGITEVNAGVYFFRRDILKSFAVEKALSCNEWYLTDIWKAGSIFLKQTKFLEHTDYRTLQGINTWAEYEIAEQFYFQIQREKAVRNGAILENCESIYIDDGADISAGTILTGPIIIGPHSVLRAHANVKPFSLIEKTVVHEYVCIGPFAKITENSILGEGVCLGSFVEVKRSMIGNKSKSKHFSYLADTVMGQSCNIGAFVVTCNYDGSLKHKTVIEDHVFVGSSSQLIAPLTLKKHSYIGAGTTVTRNVPENTILTRRALCKSRPYLKGAQLCVELSQDLAVKSD